MVKIKRLSTDEYVLEDENGEEIEKYNQTEMTHPTDWLDDAVDFGLDRWSIISGDWQFVDSRDE